MHRTLKQATAKPPQATARLQQKAFDEFRVEFNEQRPHEALQDRTPQSCYEVSPRCYPRRLAELEYGDQFQVRRVSQQGSVKWNGHRTFISEIFGHQPLGLKAVNERWLEVFYGPVSLGWLDSYRHRFARRMPKEIKNQNLSLKTKHTAVDV